MANHGKLHHKMATLRYTADFSDLPKVHCTVTVAPCCCRASTAARARALSPVINTDASAFYQHMWILWICKNVIEYNCIDAQNLSALMWFLLFSTTF